MIKTIYILLLASFMTGNVFATVLSFETLKERAEFSAEPFHEELSMSMSISDEEKRARQYFVEEALANSRIEGHEPSQADLDDWQAYISGVQSLDETEQKMVLRAIEGH